MRACGLQDNEHAIELQVGEASGRRGVVFACKWIVLAVAVALSPRGIVGAKQAVPSVLR